MGNTLRVVASCDHDEQPAAPVRSEVDVAFGPALEPRRPLRWKEACLGVRLERGKSESERERERAEPREGGRWQEKSDCHPHQAPRTAPLARAPPRQAAALGVRVETQCTAQAAGRRRAGQRGETGRRRGEGGGWERGAISGPHRSARLPSATSCGGDHSPACLPAGRPCCLCCAAAGDGEAWGGEARVASERLMMDANTRVFFLGSAASFARSPPVSLSTCSAPCCVLTAISGADGNTPGTRRGAAPHFGAGQCCRPSLTALLPAFFFFSFFSFSLSLLPPPPPPPPAPCSTPWRQTAAATMPTCRRRRRSRSLRA